MWKYFPERDRLERDYCEVIWTDLYIYLELASIESDLVLPNRQQS
jgi:hypothetical protein